jgi:lipopolysaccharide/colanic/teichoic acid biosynthesis glycosyltransferase
VNGLRGDTSIDEWAWFDNHYIDNWSMGRDLVILARTAGAVIKQARH